MDVKGVAIMTHNTRKTGIFTLALGLAMCLTVILGIISSTRSRSAPTR